MKSVLGLDLSLTSTGYAYRKKDEIITGTITPNHLRGPERLAFLSDQLKEIIHHCLFTYRKPFDLAIIEGYAYGVARGGSGGALGRIFDIGEWGGVARLTLYQHAIRLGIASPAALKMLATGNGGSAIKKPQVKQGIMDTWGYEISQDDEADAFVALMLGEAVLDARGQRRYSLDRLRALDRVEYVEPSAD